MKKFGKKRVLLLGLGTVGFGVYSHLKAAHDVFEIVGIGVKHLSKHDSLGISKKILSDDLENLLNRDADIVIELIGDPIIAEQCITKALQQGKDVVTANKFVIAEKGPILQALAEEHHVKLCYSAAVGGSVPILETIHHIKNHLTDEIHSVTGILNGTCNYMLDLISQGKTFEEALFSAQKEGYAELDPSLDIQGMDAAHKLKIIARTAFHKELSDFFVEGIEKVSTNGIVKLVAHCELKDNLLYASVKPEVVPLSHPFATIQGADNCVIIKTKKGKDYRLNGKGAGRWPTAMSVYSDILHLLSEVTSQSQNDHILLQDIRENAL
jgi:homoserine dehydrogenase